MPHSQHFYSLSAFLKHNAADLRMCACRTALYMLMHMNRCVCKTTYTYTDIPAPTEYSCVLALHWEFRSSIVFLSMLKFPASSGALQDRNRRLMTGCWSTPRVMAAVRVYTDACSFATLEVKKHIEELSARLQPFLPSIIHAAHLTSILQVRLALLTIC